MLSAAPSADLLYLFALDIAVPTVTPINVAKIPAAIIQPKGNLDALPAILNAAFIFSAAA